MTNKSILIVEDRESISGVIKDMLRSYGMEVVGIASSAKEAITLSEKMNPKVILMDILLPDGSGLDATKEILGKNPTTKIIAMSAIGDEDARERSLQAGCVEFLQKPFRMKEIMDLLESIC